MYNLLLIILFSASQYSSDWESALERERRIIRSIPPNAVIEIVDSWILYETLYILNGQDTLRNRIDYNVSDSTNSIHLLLSENLTVGDTLTICYISAAVIDKNIFFRYTRDSSDAVIDTSGYETETMSHHSGDTFSDWGNIRRKGSLTRGISFNENEGGITSGLYLELSGRPVKGVSVDAVLDDRAIPASSEGGSKTLSELDRIMFRITAPYIEAELGDWDLNWQKGYYGQVQRGLKGGKVAFDYRSTGAEAVLAGGDNSYRYVSFNGRAGDQGPYELTDRFGQPGVSVLSGSETVFLDGVRLVSGKYEDYTIDYQFGRLYFNPGIPIQADSRIEVEYEYNEANYPRYFYAGGLDWELSSESGVDQTNRDNRRTSDGRIQNQETGLDVQAFAVVEGRDENNPLAFDWSAEWRDAVSEAGDNPSGALVDGVDSVGLAMGDYIWGTDGYTRILVFSLPDSLGHPTGYLRVDFSADSTGSYQRIYDSNLRLFYFRWVGEGEGDWAPVIKIPLPDRTRMVDVQVNYDRNNLEFSSELAISERDENTLSELDDNNNTGTAFRLNSAWNAGDMNPVSLHADFRYEDERFNPISRSREADYSYLWNLIDSSKVSETAFETELRVNPNEAVSLRGTLGYLDRDNETLSRRIGVSGEYSGKSILVSSSTDVVRSDNHILNRELKRERFGAAISGSVNRLNPQYRLDYESSRQDGADLGLSGYTYHNHVFLTEMRIRDQDALTFEFTYRSDDSLSGKLVDHVSDTRIYKTEYRGNSGSGSSWNIRAHRFAQSFTETTRKSINSTVINTEYRFSPVKAAWRGFIEYDLSSGSQRVGTWVASYAGEGRGEYRREGERYVPDPDGDYTLRQVNSDTLRNVSTVRLAGNLDWDLRTNRRNDNLRGEYPLGITGISSRFVTELTTVDRDDWRVLVLHPVVYRRSEVQNSESSLRQDFEFLEGNPGGDGRITLRWSEDRDRTTAGGEGYNTKSVETAIRKYLTGSVFLQIKPSWTREKRWGLTQGESRGDVIEAGSYAELVSTTYDERLEGSLGFNYRERHNRVGGGTVIERIWSPGVNYNLAMKGIMRVEGEWRHLSSSISSPGFDLDGGFPVGDSYKLMVSLDYGLGNNLLLSAYYRGRWRGLRKPNHDGLLELTATL